MTAAPVFLEWLDRSYPGHREKIEGRIKAMRGGLLNNSSFGARMTGSGAIAEPIASIFKLFARKLGLDGDLPPLDSSRFRPPMPESGQLRLF